MLVWKLKFYGVRGSIPVCSPEVNEFGGLGADYFAANIASAFTKAGMAHQAGRRIAPEKMAEQIQLSICSSSPTHC